MGLILNIETATKVCSVALAEENTIIDQFDINEDRSHARLLGLSIQKILKNNQLSFKDLDAIAVSKGPGSYTGLRIGVSTAKGLAYGLNIPLIGVNTLKAMAQGIVQHPLLSETENSILLCPMLDARRNEVYTAIYNRTITEIQEVTALDLEQNSFNHFLQKQKMIFFGNGADKGKSIIKHTNACFISDFEVTAGNMVKLSNEYLIDQNFEDTAYFEPFYLKDFIATKPKNKVIK